MGRGQLGGGDWTIDVNIVEVGGQENGEPVPADEMLGKQRTVNVRGNGWVGSIEFLRESDSGRDVYRLAANLAAINTSLSFWVSYLETHQRSFAEELLRNVAHAR